MITPKQIDDMGWRMAEVYGAVTDQILINMARHFRRVASEGKMNGSFEWQAKKLAEIGQVTRESAKIIQSMLGDADMTLRLLLERTILEALKDVDPKLKDAASRGLLMNAAQTVAPNQMQAFQAYYQQSADKLNLVNTVMLESTQQAYAATVTDIGARIARTQGILNAATGEVITGASSYDAAIKNGLAKMVANGLTGFIDHAGRHWSPEAYVAMDVRTTVANTARASIWERNNDFGNDLYKVSWHNGARPLCYPWQSKVISRTDNVRDVTDLDGNTVHVYAQSETTYGQAAGLFGVNCKHLPLTFIPGLSTIDEPQQDEEENAKAYALSQEQRALERKLRYDKRDLEILKASGAPEEEIKAARAKVWQSSADIDAFCDKNNLPRRRNRERAAINATFPPTDSYNPADFDTTQRDQMREFFAGDRGTPPPSGTPPVVQPTPPTTPPQNVASQATNSAPDVVQSTGTEIKKTVSTVKDFAELKTYMSDTYKIDMTAGIKKLDIDLVKGAIEGFESVYADFPEIANDINKMRLQKSGVMACGNGEIVFNSDYFTSSTVFSSVTKRASEKKWWPSNASAASIGAHESAHAVESVLIDISGKYESMNARINAWNNSFEAQNIVTKAIESIKDEPEVQGKTKKELISGISGYAAMNASETMAEAFNDCYANGENANILSKAIRRVTKEVYDEYKRGAVK